jgi:hypothetical protein
MRFTKKQRKANHYSPDIPNDNERSTKNKPQHSSAETERENKTERTENEKRYDIDTGLS